MAKPPEMSGSPQNQNYKKIVGRGLKPAKQIAHEMIPSGQARATITKGDHAQRSINNYAKMSPADASGKGQVGLNLFALSRGAK